MSRDRMLRRAIALSAVSIVISAIVGLIAVAAGLVSNRLSLIRALQAVVGGGHPESTSIGTAISVVSMVLLPLLRRRQAPHGIGSSESIAPR